MEVLTLAIFRHEGCPPADAIFAVRFPDAADSCSLSV
jgi:hypothetical protein